MITESETVIGVVSALDLIGLVPGSEEPCSGEVLWCTDLGPEAERIGHHAVRCVRGITVNRASCRAFAERSLALVTALAPRIGYTQAATLAKESLRTGRTLQELVVARGLLKSSEAQRVLDASRLSRG